MNPRFVAIAAFAVLLLSPLPVGAVAQECASAETDFWRTWAAEGEAFTRPVAVAARAVLDACPPDAPDEPAPAGDVIIQTHAQTPASACGFGGRHWAGATPGQIRATLTVGPEVVTADLESATGYALYDAPARYTEVEVVGTDWTIHTTSLGVGVVTYKGVPYPLVAPRDVVTAEAGCGYPAQPLLCWGRARGISTLGGAFGLWVQGEFDGCG